MVLSALGCGESGGGGDGSSKSLFSEWTRSDNQFYVDLTDASFSTTFIMGFVLSSGEICACNAVISGSESSGSATVSSCSYVSGGSGDPGCASIWENGGSPYTYTKSGSTLELCDNPSSCGTYY